MNSWETRIERLWRAPASRPIQPLLTINLDFTCGVWSAARSNWLVTASENRRLAGVPYTLAVHPGERPPPAIDLIITVSVNRVRPRCTILVDRFRTVPSEAMDTV